MRRWVALTPLVEAGQGDQSGQGGWGGQGGQELGEKHEPTSRKVLAH